jgi:hypothetical protein
MGKTVWLGAMALALVGACSGGRVVTTTPTGSVTKPSPGYVSHDPFDKRLEHFETTYAELVCRANINYDAMASMGMLVEPYDQMTRFQEEDSTSLDPYLDILVRNGYESMAAFTADRDRINQAKRGWWDKLTGELYDLVLACNPAGP